jgi:hypothetical protein
MEFTEKYISAKENSLKPDPKKVLISDDAFAIGEVIDSLIRRIEAAARRIS